MKKQNLHILLAVSAIITSLATYTIVKLEILPVILAFMPFMLFAIVLLAFFAKPIKKHNERWSGLFVTLLAPWLLSMVSLFMLFYLFPADSMMPAAWGAKGIVILLSVNVAFALGVSFVLAAIIQTVMGGFGAHGHAGQMKKAEI